jgi:RimJ/RimL family protein N-acetyltransferase
VIRFGLREIGGESFRLREVRREDSEALYRWRMDPTSRPMFRSSEVVPMATHSAFVDRYFDAGNTDRWFVIEVEGRPVGSIALYNFADDGSAEWGRLVVAPAERGKGHGRRALHLLVGHARTIGLRRLTCEVVAGNAAAEKAYEAEGFVEEKREEVSGRVFRYLALGLTPD